MHLQSNFCLQDSGEWQPWRRGHAENRLRDKKKPAASEIRFPASSICVGLPSKDSVTLSVIFQDWAWIGPKIQLWTFSPLALFFIQAQDAAKQEEEEEAFKTLRFAIHGQSASPPEPQHWAFRWHPCRRCWSYLETQLLLATSAGGSDRIGWRDNKSFRIPVAWCQQWRRPPRLPCRWSQVGRLVLGGGHLPKVSFMASYPWDLSCFAPNLPRDPAVNPIAKPTVSHATIPRDEAHLDWWQTSLGSTPGSQSRGNPALNSREQIPTWPFSRGRSSDRVTGRNKYKTRLRTIVGLMRLSLIGPLRPLPEPKTSWANLANMVPQWWHHCKPHWSINHLCLFFPVKGFWEFSIWRTIPIQRAHSAALQDGQLTCGTHRGKTLK